MKTQAAHTNVQTEKNFVAELFVESSLSILGFIVLLLLIA